MTGAGSDVLPHHPELANLYRYVSNSPLNLLDPTGLDTVVIITWDDWAGIRWGTHAGLYIDNGGEPILFDPNGSYAPAGGSRGSGAYFAGNEANLQDYIKYHEGNSDEVETFRFSTTKAQEAAIAQRIAGSGGGSGEGEDGYLSCAYHVSSALFGIGPFQGLYVHRFPGILAANLNQILHPPPSPPSLSEGGNY
jgi:hypothetical protein